MDLITLQTRRDEADAALHLLITGSSVAEITSPSGEKVVYRQSTVNDLRTYLADLDRQIANASFTPRGPIYVIPDFSS